MIPKVRTSIPKLSIIGPSRPNVCPYESQESQLTSLQSFPIKPPNTIPLSKIKTNVHLLFDVAPYIKVLLLLSINALVTQHSKCR